MALLRTTKKSKICGVETKGFPLILKDDYSVHWLALSYFIELLGDGVVVKSINTYSKHLVDFISQLEVDGKEIDMVDDDWLKEYKNAITSRKGIGKKNNTENYASQLLRSTITFLHWLEINKYIRGVAGEGKNYKVRITIYSKGIKHALMTDVSSDNRKNITPRLSWIHAIKPYGPKRSDLANRFEIMIDWYTSLGLRAFEGVNLKISQLPKLETAEKAIIDKKNLKIMLLLTKGGDNKLMPISPLLIKNTWDYIINDRCIIVEEFKKRKKKQYLEYSESEYIFLSDKTGEALSEKTISNQIRKAFLAAVEAGELTIDERVWTHGLRHNFANRTIKKFDKDENVKKPETLTKQLTRHKSYDSLDIYTTERFNEDFDE